MNLSDLTPAPWRCTNTDDPTDDGQGFLYVAGPTGFPLLLPERDDAEGEAALRFAAMARNAFDIMISRGWTVHVSPDDGKCWVEANDIGFGGVDRMDWNPGEFAQWLDGRFWTNPFIALIETDKWYVENIEKQA